MCGHSQNVEPDLLVIDPLFLRMSPLRDLTFHVTLIFLSGDILFQGEGRKNLLFILAPFYMPQQMIELISLFQIYE
jgi:hypothetical protein